jgi:O-methyltransferase involved in polyketide biosynthesis
MVGIDLRDDWPAALLAQGFDPDRPSSWVTEGLLAQLPAEAQDLLFARLDSLAAVGNRLVADSPGTDPARLRESPDLRALMKRHTVAELSVSDERRRDIMADFMFVTAGKS